MTESKTDDPEKTAVRRAKKSPIDANDHLAFK